MSQIKQYIIAGIGTEVGKTVVSSIVTEKLQADYWKPIQAGDLDQSDSIKVEKWVSNTQTHIHPEGVRLNHPMSPHAAADLENRRIHLSDLNLPESSNDLIVELAGGILVPINHQITNLDLIKKIKLPVILVVNFYLGSINHTLLSIECLKSHQVKIEGLIFNGEINEASKEVILEMSGCKNLGEVPPIQGEITSEIVHEYGKYIQL
ncbi:dethiobiotin synthase [bacterium SCSIO 12643]|nr:dethiobiotin synthase [bacterium SCSIO 12643]